MVSQYQGYCSGELSGACRMLAQKVTTLQGLGRRYDVARDWTYCGKSSIYVTILQAHCSGEWEKRCYLKVTSNVLMIWCRWLFVVGTCCARRQTMLLQGQRHCSDEMKEGRLLSEGRQCTDGYRWLLGAGAHCGGLRSMLIHAPETL